jgi:hypothetical protein
MGDISTRVGDLSATEGSEIMERKNLTITQVEEVKKVGNKQIPKLSFKAKDGESELSYFTFRNSLFEAIKVGQSINADVETSTREWEGQTYTDRRVVQIYVDGQPIGGKKEGYRGKSPEELEQTARTMCLSYAKDLVVAQVIPLEVVLLQADSFYAWVKNGKGATPKALESKLEGEVVAPVEAKSAAPLKVQNITELKGLMAKHKVATHEAYVILSIKSFTELTITPSEAWEQIKKVKGL